MDGARGRARTAILPRVHLSRENHECQFFMRRGHSFFFVYFVAMTALPFSCAFVCIRGSKMDFRVFRGFRIGISWL